MAVGLVAAAQGVGAAEDVRSALANGFTADVTNHTEAKGRTMTLNGTLYFSKDKTRVDNTLSVDQQAMSSTVIIRLDKQVVWTLMPQQRLYVETVVKPADVARVAAMSRDWSALKPVGTELVNGQMADKYDQSSDTCAVYTYVSSGSHLPLKTEATCPDTHVVTDYKNVRPGAPPAQVFELPGGYEKFDPSAMMQMGLKMLEQQGGSRR